MRKKWGVILLLLFTSGWLHSEVFGIEKGTQIEQIVDVLAKNDVTISSWTVYAREYIEIKEENDFLNKVRKLSKEYADFSWVIQKKSEVQKAIGRKNNETIQLVSPKTDEKAYLLYEIKGIKAVQWNNLNEHLYEQTKKIFVNNPQIFSCVTGNISGKMVSGLNQFSNQLLRQFHATEIESLQEEAFISISAYNKQWKQTIPTEKKPMNIQLSVRKASLDTYTVVIGTPIITVEY